MQAALFHLHTCQLNLKSCTMEHLVWCWQSSKVVTDPEITWSNSVLLRDAKKKKESNSNKELHIKLFEVTHKLVRNMPTMFSYKWHQITIMQIIISHNKRNSSTSPNVSWCVYGSIQCSVSVFWMIFLSTKAQPEWEMWLTHFLPPPPLLLLLSTLFNTIEGFLFLIEVESL